MAHYEKNYTRNQKNNFFLPGPPLKLTIGLRFLVEKSWTDRKGKEKKIKSTSKKPYNIICSISRNAQNRKYYEKKKGIHAKAYTKRVHGQKIDKTRVYFFFFLKRSLLVAVILFNTAVKKVRQLHVPRNNNYIITSIIYKLFYIWWYIIIGQIVDYFSLFPCLGLPIMRMSNFDSSGVVSTRFPHPPICHAGELGSPMSSWYKV